MEKKTTKKTTVPKNKAETKKTTKTKVGTETKKKTTSTKTVSKEKKLTDTQWAFVDEYMRCFDATKAYIKARKLDEQEDIDVNDLKERRKIWTEASAMRRNPSVSAELLRRMQERSQIAVADAAEVMRYLTSVMRGEIKDQFGLDAPLSERTKAAQELARRTVDVEAAVTGKGVRSGNGQINITLDFDGL